MPLALPPSAGTSSDAAAAYVANPPAMTNAQRSVNGLRCFMRDSLSRSIGRGDGHGAVTPASGLVAGRQDDAGHATARPARKFGLHARRHSIDRAMPGVRAAPVAARAVPDAAKNVRRFFIAAAARRPSRTSSAPHASTKPYRNRATLSEWSAESIDRRQQDQDSIRALPEWRCYFLRSIARRPSGPGPAPRRRAASWNGLARNDAPVRYADHGDAASLDRDGRDPERHCSRSPHRAARCAVPTRRPTPRRSPPPGTPSTPRAHASRTTRPLPIRGASVRP